MSLLSYQESLILNNLYEVEYLGNSITMAQFHPNIYVDSGSIDMYISNSAVQPTSLSDMRLLESNTNITGGALSAVFRYVAMIENSSSATTPTEVVTTGVKVINDLGAIA